MNRRQKKDVVAAIEADAPDPGAWEDDPVRAGGTTKRVLGTHVTIRLEPELADQVRRIATELGVGYTSLLRDWIEERVRGESQTKVKLTVSGQPAVSSWSEVLPSHSAGYRLIIQGAEPVGA